MDPAAATTLALFAIAALLVALVLCVVVVALVLRQLRRASPAAPPTEDPAVAELRLQLDQVQRDTQLLTDSARYLLAESVAHDEDLRQILTLVGGKPRAPHRKVRPPFPRSAPPLPGDDR